MRLPNGACSTSCMPPDSSKKRSSTSVSCVGIDAERLAPCRRDTRRPALRRAALEPGLADQPLER